MQRFLVGTYSQGEGDLFTLWLDAEKGLLTLGPVYTGCESPSFLALDGDKLYAVSERLEGGAVASFTMAEDGTLTRTAYVDAPYPGLCHVCVWPNRQAVSFASYFGGGAFTCALKPDGSLGSETQWLPNHGRGAHPVRQDQAHVHSLTPDASGRYIIEADLGLDRLAVLQPDGVKLTRHAETAVPDGEGPRHFLFHPNGQVAWLVTELSNRVLLFDYDAACGALTLRDGYALLDTCAPENCAAADIHLTPDGRFLFVSVRGIDKLVRFEVAVDGTLGNRAFVPCGARAVRNFCIEPSGRFLLVADQHANEVRLFAITPQSGAVSECLCSVRIPSPVCVISA